MITRLGQLDFVRPIRSFEFNPSRHASEVDNYLDAIQTTGVGDYISKTGSSDTFEREDKRNILAAEKSPHVKGRLGNGK